MMRSTRFASTAVAAGLLLATAADPALAQTLQSQSLTSRVSSAPDGPVQFTFAARAGTCGNGRSYIQTAPSSTGSVSYTGTFSGSYSDAVRLDPCVPGPLRVVIDRADKQPLSIETFVGPVEPAAAGVTDIGAVRAQDAANYLLSLASSVDGRAGRQALLPAMLADSANTAPSLIAIAKNSGLPRETRRGALSYLGRSTDGLSSIPANVTDPILAIARDEADNQSVRQQALSVLGRLDHGAGIPPLIELSRQTESSWLAKESMSALSRSGDPRARAYLRTAVRRTDLPDEVRTVALRSLGRDYATAQDAAVLRDVYASLASDRQRTAVLSALADIGGAENTRWLLRTAQDGQEQLSIRRRALDAASRSGASIGDLVRLYDTTTDPSMKEALVGIYIRSGERSAVDKLLSIMKAEPNLAVRRRAISRMSSSDDPRVKKALLELIVR